MEMGELSRPIELSSTSAWLCAQTTDELTIKLTGIVFAYKASIAIHTRLGVLLYLQKSGIGKFRRNSWVVWLDRNQIPLVRK